MHKLLAGLSSGALKALGSSISPDEDVFVCITNSDGAALIGLSDRIVIVKKRKTQAAANLGWLYGMGWIVNSFPYQQVTGIYVRKGVLLSGVIAVETASFSGSGVASVWADSEANPTYLPNTLVVTKKELETRFEPQLEILRQAVRNKGFGNVSQPQPAVQTGAGSGDLSAEIQRLAQLRASGVLTDDEFAKAKAKLLG